MTQTRIRNLIFVLILVAYAAYAAVYIFESSFVVDGTRYYVLFDDAMISMVYARNVAHGLGPVWNPGERVEGFTNPLWVAFMALFHFLPISAPLISLPIQIAGGLFFIGSLYFTKKIAEELSPGALVPLLAVFVTAFYGQLSTWSLLGMEVSVLLLITTAAVWLAIRQMKTGKFSPWLYILLGVGTLVRLDMAVPYLAILSFLFVADPANRKRHLLWGVSLFVAFLGGQTLLRWLYYGEWLPNTYYLKVTGAPLLLVLKRGVFVFVKFVWNFNPALFALPFLVILARREKATLLMAWVFAAFCAYSVYVGGDAWESKGGANRFISTGIPLFFVLFAYSLELIRQALVGSQQSALSTQQSAVSNGTEHRGQPSALAHRLSALGVIIFALIGLVNFNALLDTSSLKYWLLLERHPFVPGSERYVNIANLVDQVSTPDAKVAVVTAGIIAYYSERDTIDMLGKSDKVIAREPMHLIPGLPLIDLRPGHMKWNYAYSIGELKPDVIAQMYSESPREERDKWVVGYTPIVVGTITFYVRDDSPYVLWDEVEKLKSESNQ